MEWDRYYQETEVLPFNAQAPYYTYLLEQLSPYILRGKDLSQPISVALGGLHPTVTHPDHFTTLCSGVFNAPLHTFILDQNFQALNRFSASDAELLIQAKLEHLPLSTPLSLLVCDFTLDFMSDSQITTLNQTLPTVLDSTGVFIVTQDNPFIPQVSQLHNKLKYGINVYPRTTHKLKTMLSSFKSIYECQIRHDTNVTIYTHRNSQFPEHQGMPFLLDPETGNFSYWLNHQ